jgi:hypothetical protein
MWRLPDPADLRQRFREAGVLLVPDALDATAASELAGEALALSGRSGRHIRRSSDAGVLDYGVITGDVIKTDAPRLFALYESVELLEWIRAVAETASVERSPHVRSAINVNILGRRGQEYRWHTDAVPFTALLFLTTIPEGAGGELLVRLGEDDVMSIRPVSGQLALMDGHRRAHAVAPLVDNGPRISVPMVFPATSVDRPDGLDDYLYAT